MFGVKCKYGKRKEKKKRKKERKRNNKQIRDQRT
jgi:hypothetical protein